MKRAKRIIALLALLCVVLAANVVIRKIGESGEDAVSEEKGAFILTEYEIDDVSAFEWSKGEDKLAFALTGGVWQYPSDAYFPVNQDSAQALADAAMDITADRKIENIESLSDYGLASPAFTLRISFSDGSDITYSMGDQTPFQDGYYVSVSGQADVVYVVGEDFSPDFSLTLYDYAKAETLPETGDVVYISAGDFEAEYLSESKTVDPDQNWYGVTSGQPLDEEKIEALISEISELSLGELKMHNASDDDLNEYSLTDEASARITVRDADGNEKTLLVGVRDNSYFARLADSRMVYSLSGNGEEVLSASETDMRIMSVAPVAFSDVSQITFMLDALVHTVQRSEETVYATGGEADETVVVVTRNGVQTDGKQEEEAWNLMSGLILSSYAEAEAYGSEILCADVTCESGISLSIAVYEYDADFYLIAFSDGRTGLIEADGIDRIVRRIKQFA